MILALLGCPEPTPTDTAELPAVDTILHDSVSMPIDPLWSTDQFSPATTCAECHPTQYADWSSSMHAYAMRDMAYQAVVSLRQDEFAGAQDAFCLQCHSAIGTRGGEIYPGFSFDELSPVVMEGVTCEACHKATRLARTYNSGHVLDPDGPQRACLDGAQDDDHDVSFTSMFESSSFCAGCHEVYEVNGLPLERPYQEWQTSPAAAAGRNCQTCHMARDFDRAATDGPLRTVYRHTFQGVGLPLDEDFETPEVYAARREAVQRLLDDCVTVSLDVPGAAVPGETVDVLVSLTNEIDAHNFPTGSTFNRQAWLELVATDARGVQLYSTGDLDTNGDLRDYFSELDPYGDADLIKLSSTLIAEDGSPTFLTWHATEHQTGALPPLYTRTYTLFVPTTADTVGPLTISARVRIRGFAPFVLRAVGLDDKVDRNEIFDVDATTISVPL